MKESLLSVHLDEEQVDELISALRAHRDHFVELIESNSEAVGLRAREDAHFWQGKVRSVQELIDQVSDSLYGAQPRSIDGDAPQNDPSS